MEEIIPFVMAVAGFMSPPACSGMFIYRSCSSLSPTGQSCHHAFLLLEQADPCPLPWGTRKGLLLSPLLLLGLTPASSKITPGPQLFLNCSSLPFLAQVPTCTGGHLLKGPSGLPGVFFFPPHPLTIVFFKFSCSWV